MSIKVACLECNRVYEIPDAAAGRKGKCECGALLNVPAKDRPSRPAPPKSVAEIPVAPIIEEPSEPELDSEATPELAGPLAVDQEFGAPEAAEYDLLPDGNTPPPLPPLPPPPQQATTANAATPAERPTPRYPKLREYAALINVCGAIVYYVGILVALATTAVGITIASTSPAFDWIVMAVTIVSTLFALAQFYLVSMLLKAAAELLHVLMDIEENTRR